MKNVFGAAFGLMLTFGTLLAGDVSGKWNFVFETQIGQREAVMTFQVKGDNVTGKIEMADTEVQGTFTDAELALAFPFYSPDAGFEAELKITGKLEGDKITGTWEFSEYSGSLTATRAK